MTTNVSTSGMTKKGLGQGFRAESTEVLDVLRNRVAEVLSALGSFNRPAEVHKALGLDKTLCRQLFKVAGTAEPLGSSSVVPSRGSMGRFLDAARDRGISSEALKEVWDAYENFGKLVHTHAGDRTTFNTMFSSITGEDEEWAVNDSQHRRHGFRTISHAMGVQAKTILQLFIVNEIDNGTAFEVAKISGTIGLRILHVQPSVRVDGMFINRSVSGNASSWEPLGLSSLAGGHLLEEFSSKPVPEFRLIDSNEPGFTSREIRIQNPELGNMGVSTLVFGSYCARSPADGTLMLHVSNGRPAEVLIFDVLTSPGIVGGLKPTGSAMLGYNEKYGAELLPLRGKYDAEFLGKGSRALSTPEVPHYTEMVNAVATKMRGNLDEFDAWRIRAEFPLYHSTLCMNWKPTS